MSFQRFSTVRPFTFFTNLFIIFSFLFSSIIMPISPVLAQATVNSVPQIAIQPLNTAFTPSLIKGVKLYANNPFRLDFVIDPGESGLQDEELKIESEKLIKYFLTSMTVPEADLWVNLSPYEKDRIIPTDFGKTEMGRDLLAEDYKLKQITASLMNPEKEIGAEFWQRINEKVAAQFGDATIPVNNFNKVWIVPSKATLFEQGDTVVVTDSYLKVMLEVDYVALENNSYDLNTENNILTNAATTELDDVSSAIIREIIIPELEQEINTGENFATLRQIYHSVILATWFKQNLRESFLGSTYMDQNKVAGITSADTSVNEKIYAQYVNAFETGAYNFVQQNFNTATQEVIEQKYFSGGAALAIQPEVYEVIAAANDDATVPAFNPASVVAGVELYALNENNERTPIVIPVVANQEESFTDVGMISAQQIYEKELEWKLYEQILAASSDSPLQVRHQAEEVVPKLASFLRSNQAPYNRSDPNDLLNKIEKTQPQLIDELGGEGLFKVEGEQLAKLLDRIETRLNIQANRLERNEIIQQTTTETSMGKLDILEGQTVMLRGPGAVGLQVAKSLLESGAKVILFDLATQTQNHAKIRDELKSYFDNNQVALFLEDQDPTTGEFSRKYMDPFGNFADKLAEMEITRESGIQGFVPASQFESVHENEIHLFKEMGIKWMAFVENNVFKGDPIRASQLLKENGIVAAADFLNNSGGVRGAMYGFTKNDISRTFVVKDIIEKTRENFQTQERTGDSGLEVAKEQSRKITQEWEEAGIVYTDKLTYAQSQADLVKVQEEFAAFKAEHAEAEEEPTLYDFLVQESQREANLRNPKRFDGVQLPNGVTVRVVAYQEDLPENTVVRGAWEDHYAAFLFEHEDGTLSALAQHKLVKLDSHLEEFDEGYWTIGGTRMSDFADRAEGLTDREALLRFVFEFSREMTWKNGAGTVLAGGSKNAILPPEGITADSREVPEDQIEARNAILIRDAQANGFLTRALKTGALLAQDLGMSPADVKLRSDVTISYNKYGTELAERNVASAPYSAQRIDQQYGKNPGPLTALTSFTAALVAANYAEEAETIAALDVANLGNAEPEITAVTNGGIDFNANNLQLETQGTGIDAGLLADPTQFNNVNLEGLAPVILEINPIMTVPALRQLSETEQDAPQQLSRISGQE